MRRCLTTLSAVGILLLGGLAGLTEASERGEPPEPTGPTMSPLALLTTEFAGAAAFQGGGSPRFTYASGSQGVRYYANSGVRAANAAPAPRFSGGNARARGGGSRPRTVGPGARDWGTGQNLGLHRPWLRSRG